MVSVIEIIDSDEETPAPQLGSADVEPVPNAELTNDDTETEATAAGTGEQLDVDSEKNKTKNRRKAVHQVMRASPEMQFQTIFDESKKKRKPRRKNTSQTASGADNDFDTDNSTPTPPVDSVNAELLIKPPTVAEVLSAACDELLNLEKADEMIRKVAEYRIRINFLLNACSMKEMTFTLGSDLERLKLMFNQRLMQINCNKLATERNAKIDENLPNATELSAVGCVENITSTAEALIGAL